MLYQLHWQYKSGLTEMRSQKDINSSDEMRKFVKETVANHPLPDDAVWMACDERSICFVVTKAKNNKTLHATDA